MLRLQRLQPRGLEAFDLTVETGECVAVRGPSGGGKTLLLRAVADLDAATDEAGIGEALLDGTPRSAMSGPAWRRRVMYVAADSGWWADRVGDHFEDWAGLAARTGTLGLPADCERWKVGRLSTGERQRLALLRALEREPRVLLLDEPTAGLDAEAVTAAEALIRDRQRAGVSVLWVTHDAAQAERVASRSLTVAHGRIEVAA